MIVTRTPFRITLGGGGTDLPSYYKHNGGLVASLAIDQHVYITLKPDYWDNLCKLRYSEIEVTDDLDTLKNTRAREALKIHGVRCVEINTCADLSAKTGLGSSGSFLVGLLKAIREYKQIKHNAAIVAEEACHIEIDRLGEPVGKQDQYIAAYGGTQLFTIAKDGTVSNRALNINQSLLIQNMHLYSLDVYRNASEVLKEQNKMQGDTKKTLDNIRDIGKQQISLLESGDFNKYGQLLDVYWAEKKKLSSKVSLPIVDEIYEIVKAEYQVLGGKIIGAGGGGFLMLYVDNKHEEVEMYMKERGLRRLHYNADFDGSKVLGNFL
jgi:D-glycero-alpha-D-manno-heptose-7-phosphate kinase